mgnify:CR=1 FL=1
MLLKSGLLLRKFRANVGCFPNINRLETESQPHLHGPYSGAPQRQRGQRPANRRFASPVAIAPQWGRRNEIQHDDLLHIKANQLRPEQ